MFKKKQNVDAECAEVLQKRTFESVREILADHVGVGDTDPEEITENTTLDDLGMDELDIVEIAIALEMEYEEYELNLDNLSKDTTVKDILDILKSNGVM